MLAQLRLPKLGRVVDNGKILLAVITNFTGEFIEIALMKILTLNVARELGKEPIRKVDYGVFNDNEISMTRPDDRRSGFDRLVFEGLNEHGRSNLQGQFLHGPDEAFHSRLRSNQHAMGAFLPRCGHAPALR